MSPNQLHEKTPKGRGMTSRIVLAAIATVGGMQAGSTAGIRLLKAASDSTETSIALFSNHLENLLA
jgi:hypothetical protein